MHPEISPSSLKIFCPAHTILTFVARKISAIQLDLKKAPLTRVHIHGALRNKANVYKVRTNYTPDKNLQQQHTRRKHQKNCIFPRPPCTLAPLRLYTLVLSLSSSSTSFFCNSMSRARALDVPFRGAPLLVPSPGPFQKSYIYHIPGNSRPFLRLAPSYTPPAPARALCSTHTRVLFFFLPTLNPGHPYTQHIQRRREGLSSPCFPRSAILLARSLDRQHFS